MEDLKEEIHKLAREHRELGEKLKSKRFELIDTCPHISREREYDVCDQRHYWICLDCGTCM